MSLNIELTCEAQSGETLCISGEHESLGGWDTSKALRLQKDAASSSLWRGEIPAAVNGQFKFAAIGEKRDVRWEPFEGNRSFPSTGLREGALVATKFGELKMSITASAAQLEAQARAYRDIDNRQGSALQDNLDKKGEHAYYAAHSRKFEVPADAKVVTGEGLITGGPPVLLEVGSETMSEDDRTVFLKDYSWSDSGKKVKVYVPIGEGLLPSERAEDIVETTYNTGSIDLIIKSKPRQRLKIDKLNADITPEDSSTRVEAKKNRIVLQLAKKREATTWYNLTKSK